MEQKCINSEAVLAGIADQIRGLEKKTIGNVVETGRQLREAQRLCKHGKWLEWIEAELGWSDQTSRRYIKIAKFAERFDLTGRDLSITALHMIVDLGRSHPATDAILQLSLSSRVTKASAVRIRDGIANVSCAISDELRGTDVESILAPPLAPNEPYGKVRRQKADRARASLFGLCRAIKYPLKDWEDAAQSVPPVQLRTIIDRLELIYQSRTASRFEDA